MIREVTHVESDTLRGEGRCVEAMLSFVFSYQSCCRQVEWIKTIMQEQNVMSSAKNQRGIKLRMVNISDAAASSGRRFAVCRWSVLCLRRMTECGSDETTKWGPNVHLLSFYLSSVFSGSQHHTQPTYPTFDVDSHHSSIHHPFIFGCSCPRCFRFGTGIHPLKHLVLFLMVMKKHFARRWLTSYLVATIQQTTHTCPRLDTIQALHRKQRCQKLHVLCKSDPIVSKNSDDGN